MFTPPFQSIRFWFNAFIPAHIPGFTETIAEGRFRGKTGLVNVVESCGLVLTDQRPFSDDMSAISQLQSRGEILFRGSAPLLEQAHVVDLIAPLPSEGAASPSESPPDANVPVESQMSLVLYTYRTLTASSPAAALIRTMPGYGGSPQDQMVYIHVDCRAAIPHTELASRLGELAYRGVLALDLGRRAATFHGHVGRFPAYELYVAVDNRPPKALFRASPIRGANAYDGTMLAPRGMRGEATLG
jgi:hypothetical protein